MSFLTGLFLSQVSIIIFPLVGKEAVLDFRIVTVFPMNDIIVLKVMHYRTVFLMAFQLSVSEIIHSLWSGEMFQGYPYICPLMWRVAISLHCSIQFYLLIQFSHFVYSSQIYTFSVSLVAFI